MRRAFGAIGLLLMTAFSSGRLALSHRYEAAALEVCDLVETHFYRVSELSVQSWIHDCRERASTQPFLMSRQENIKRINDHLSLLGSSHLAVYRPEESAQMWENRAVESGLRARFVENDLVVYRVVPKSPAAEAGAKVGDVLVTLNRAPLNSASEAAGASGEVAVRRRGKQLLLTIEAREMTDDLSPQLSPLKAGMGLLRLPSFLPDYFESSAWKKVSSELGSFRQLVIDLRDNAGGSFPAMVRALAPFRCEDPVVGTLSGSAPAGQTDLRDVLDARSQLEQLSDFHVLRLRTNSEYGCFSGSVITLIDSGTSSVAEIFAEALKNRRRSAVWGQPSAGEVVMAQWFPVNNFDLETTISIPIAEYQDQDGVILEDKGVEPDHLLYYDHADAVNGVDTWLKRATQH